MPNNHPFVTKNTICLGLKRVWNVSLEALKILKVVLLTSDLDNLLSPDWLD